MKRSIITTDIKAEVLGSNADSSSSRLRMESVENKLVPVNAIDFGSKRKLEVDPESHAVDPFGSCHKAVLESPQTASEKAEQSLCSLTQISLEIIPEFVSPCSSSGKVPEGNVGQTQPPLY